MPFERSKEIEPASGTPLGVTLTSSTAKLPSKARIDTEAEQQFRGGVRGRHDKRKLAVIELIKKPPPRRVTPPQLTLTLSKGVPPWAKKKLTL